MKALPLLLLGAFALVLAQPAQAQNFCVSDNTNGIALTVQLNTLANAFSGTSDVGSGRDWQVTGGRGPNSRLRRHHSFTAINPDLNDDPSCDDGGGFVDWIEWNGQVGGGGFPYNYNGIARNSCSAAQFPFSGTITQGACPAPLQDQPASALTLAPAEQ